MPQTFAQYLISQILPPDIRVEEQIDKSYFTKLLSAVATKHPEQYDRVITNLKRLADHISTMEAATIGLDEIDVPNKANRDAIIKRYEGILAHDKKVGDRNIMLNHLGDLQEALAKNDLDGTTDDASLMVRSSLTGKKTQLMKMRSGPGVVKGHDDQIVPEIFPKSYAQGVDPLQFWLGAVESRKNLAEGAINTAKPGEMNKLFSNLLCTGVVGVEDCGTTQGILLGTRDDSIVDRYLARDTDKYKRNTLITPDVQQDLLKAGITNVLVRSPQTCMGKGGSVCQLCMGLRPGTGKKYEIGDNAGLITAGNLGEPLQQATLSSKHSAAKAEVFEGLRGEKGFRQFVESSKIYPNRKVLCEVIGVVSAIRPAPQGGNYIYIRTTKPVPKRYIELGKKGQGGIYSYYVSPNLRILDNIKVNTEVWPGMELTSGVDNIKDVARLRNLGFLRSVASQNMYQIYKDTGIKLDRRHFELLSRAVHPYVKVLSIPRGYDIMPGETVKYQDLVDKIQKMPKRTVQTTNAMGKILGEGVLNLTVGTEIDAQVMQYLIDNGVKQIMVADGLEIEAVATPLTRVVNKSDDWLATLNHRYLKRALKEAAGFGRESNIHGYNAVTAYAYGSEMGYGPDGKY